MKKLIKISQINVLFIFGGCLLIIGCYTIINHPELNDAYRTENEFIDDNVTHFDECSQCHTNYQYFFQPYSEFYHSTSYHNFYDWEFYYDLPWWYDERYNYSSSSGSSNEHLPPTQQRDFGRQGNSSPDYPSSTPASNANSPHLSKESSNTSDANQQSSTDTSKRSENRRDTSSDKTRKSKDESSSKKKKD